MSVLQLALVGLVRSRRFAAGRGHGPAVCPLVKEIAAALGALRERTRLVHARVHDAAALGQFEAQDRLLARLLLLLLELRSGLLAELVAGRLAVAALERRVEALRHGRGLVLAVRRPAAGKCQRQQAGG